ncbi:hypothetical protein [Spirosoma sp.]|uniref:hypothetical protein n=1 Tax=Spirosoma sp. TaxID=1899569 RepID=UPI003B3B71B6
MIGFIAFIFTTLFLLGLALLTGTRPNLSGDNAMGYGLGLFFLGIGFALSSLALTLTILAKNGFQWVASDASLRTAMVLLTWLCIAATTFFCAIFKWEWSSNDDNTYPQFLHWLALWNGQLWIPLLWLLACFLSLSANLQTHLSPVTLKSSFFTAMAIGIVYCGGLVVGFLRDSARQADMKMASEREQADRWHQQTLNYIASQKPGDPIVHLLVHTNQSQKNDVRQAALAKVREHADAESELLELLNLPTTYYYREVYYYLDGNTVTRSEEFAQALNESIVRLAASISADITDSNNLQHWSFNSSGISQLLRAIDEQFLNTGVDFRPNILTLRKAFNTPPPDRFKDVQYDIVYDINTWLNQHK